MQCCLPTLSVPPQEASIATSGHSGKQDYFVALGARKLNRLDILIPGQWSQLYIVRSIDS